MTQPDPTSTPSSKEEQGQPRGKRTSKQVTNHLANERTFLAWVRTGLATITFGFVVARFGLLLRELGLKHISTSDISIHYSSLIGISLTIFGILMIVMALLNFLRIRTKIDTEQFYPQSGLAIVLTILACLIGITLAIYLFFTT
jgi:putative membrane protein